MGNPRPERHNQSLDLPEGFTGNKTRWNKGQCQPIVDYDQLAMMGITEDDDCVVCFNHLDGQWQADRYVNEHDPIPDPDSEDENEKISWWGGSLRKALQNLPVTINNKRVSFGKVLFQPESDREIRERLKLSGPKLNAIPEDRAPEWDSFLDELNEKYRGGEISHQDHDTIMNRKWAELCGADPIPENIGHGVSVQSLNRTSYHWAYHVTNNDIKL
jgi:hypothetical protein